jgi:hypothetical protein
LDSDRESSSLPVEEDFVNRRPAPRKTVNLSESIHHQLNMYALAAGAAGVSMLALSQPAEAKIIYTAARVTIDAGSCHNLDLTHTGRRDFCLWRTRYHYGTVLAVYPDRNISEDGAVGSAEGWFEAATAMPRGAKIDHHDFFNNSPGLMADVSATTSNRGTLWRGQWANGGKGLKDGYLGLRFKFKGRVHYGWARITVKTSKNLGFTAILTGFAYETIPGKAIIAGQTKGKDEIDDSIGQTNPALTAPTPQPASLGALALGAPGLSIWRREETQEVIGQ